MYEQLSLNPIITNSLHNVNRIFITRLSLFTLLRTVLWKIKFKDFQRPASIFKDFQGHSRTGKSADSNYYDNYLLSAKWFSRLYVCVYVIVLHALSVWRMKVFITTFGVAWFVTASLTKACQLALVLLTPFHCLAHRQVVLPNRHTWINK